MQLELLTRQHDRKTFSSGEQSLDNWFRDFSIRDQESGACKVWCLMDDQVVAGFFTCTPGAVPKSELDLKLFDRFRYSNLSYVLIGRLARDQRFRSHRLGTLLVLHALDVASRVEQAGGLKLVVVDALNRSAMDFYHGLGFKTFPSNEGVLRPRMFLPWDTASQMLSAWRSSADDSQSESVVAASEARA